LTPSALPDQNCRVKLSEFDSAIGGCEAPADPGFFFVPFSLPFGEGGRSFLTAVEVVLHALPGKNAHFDLGPIRFQASMDSKAKPRF